MSILKATPAQRKNITILLGYLRQQLVARNDTYNHDNIATCTIGFAIKSRLFPCLNRYTIVTDTWGRINVEHEGRSGNHHAIVSELVMGRMFGKDYLNYIVFPNRADNNTFNPYRASNIASLRYVIKHISRLYGMDEAASVNPEKSAIAVEADTLRRDAEQRVAELEELVKSCDVIYKHSPLQAIKSIKDTSIIELRILQNLLKK